MAGASMSWDKIRQNIAYALNWVKARENSEQALGTTLEQSILEEVVRIDSSQVDPVQTLGEGNLIDYRDDGSLRPGSLQELDKLEKYFFGESGSDGVIERIKREDDPALIGRDF